ncbi:hypothetical protein [Mesorhizobium sp. 1B3]|uniref:hypothetical protein n=1 Tax=Mesorhizobium sp. 1B3 TaxID=3243599 RepID=UPI003D974ABC
MSKLAAAIAGLLLSIGVANTADWSSYSNARFGYQIDVPPAFSKVSEADNADGGVSKARDGRGTLRVWGGHITEADFQSEVTWRIRQDLANGWEVTYRKIHPAWASWSETKGDQVFYQSAVAACDGAAAYFRLEYDRSQLKAFDPVVSRLVNRCEAVPAEADKQCRTAMLATSATS